MKKFNYKTLGIIGVIVVVVVIAFSWYASTRNHFVQLDEAVNKQWAQVENQYQRRLQLIPNLVNTVKGWAAHEAKTYESVTRARAGLDDATRTVEGIDAAQATSSEQSLAQFDAAQQQLGRALNIYMNAVHEAYPDLKNEQFTDLQVQLEGTENRIATERQRYVDGIEQYNVAVRSFPASIVASMSGFAVKPQFRADPGAGQVPTVNFD